MAIVAALASVQPDGIDATIDWLVAHKRELAAAYDGGCDGKLGVAKVPPEMEYTEELGFLDRAKNDVVLRDRYLFADVIGQRGFFQTAVYAMTGIELPAREAEMLDQIGNATLQPDRRAWLMAVTRRVGARGGGYQAAVLAGFAMMGAPMIAGEAAASCARFLMRAQAADRPVAELVVELLAHVEPGRFLIVVARVVDRIELDRVVQIALFVLAFRHCGASAERGDYEHGIRRETHPA
jgi:hypothetical protein